MKKSKATDIIEFYEDAGRYEDAALEAIERGDFMNALKNAQEAVRIFPEEIEFRLMLCEIYLAMGLHHKCLQTAVTAIALDAKNVEGYYFAMRSNAELNAIEESCFFLNEGMKYGLGTDDEGAALDVLSDMEPPLEIRKSHLRLLDVADEYADTIDCARDACVEGDFSAAEKYLNSLPKDAARTEEALAVRAEAFGAQNPLYGATFARDAAKEQASELLSLIAAHYYCVAGRQEAAREILSTLAYSSTEDAAKCIHWARTLLEADLTEKADDVVRQGLKRFPHDEMLLSIKVCTASWLGRFHDAQETVFFMLALDPTNSMGYYYNKLLQGKKCIDKNFLLLPPEEIEQRYHRLRNWEEQAIYETDSDENIVYNTAILKWAMCRGNNLTETGHLLTVNLACYLETEGMYRSLCVDARTTWLTKRNSLAALLCRNCGAVIIQSMGHAFKMTRRIPKALTNDIYYSMVWSLSVATRTLFGLKSSKNIDDMVIMLSNRHREFWMKPKVAGSIRVSFKTTAAVVLLAGLGVDENTRREMFENGMLAGLVDDMDEVEILFKRLYPELTPFLETTQSKKSAKKK